MTPDKGCSAPTHYVKGHDGYVLEGYTCLCGALELDYNVALRTPWYAALLWDDAQDLGLRSSHLEIAWE